MARRLPFVLVALLALTGPAGADEMGAGAPPAGGAAPAAPAPGAPPVAPALASDDTATKAIAVFKEAWKAKGLKGDERLSQRDWALDELSKVQHPLVVAELGAVAKMGGDDDLRLMATIYLARQKALPGAAGEQVLQALAKYPKDTVLLLSGIQTLGKLKYLGADDALKDLVKNDDWAVRKAAITTVGDIGDIRLIDELLKLLGIDVKSDPPAAPSDEKKGGKEVVEEGYSWEGAEATVDHGHADNTQENAEAKAKAEAQIAANKAAAAGGKGGGGGAGGVGGGGSSGGRGGSSRNPTELRPFILRTLKALTGETFTSSREVHIWFRKSDQLIATKKKECDAGELAQKTPSKP